MKKIAMFTMGTRGDVQPYIILSRALMNSGFDVTLGSHPCWRSLIESYGVHFEPVGPDIDIEAEAAAIRGKSSNAALSMIRCMNFIMKKCVRFTRRLCLPTLMISISEYSECLLPRVLFPNPRLMLSSAGITHI